MARKASDEFTVPLCRGHHREVHRSGDEAEWWSGKGIDPNVAARSLWLKSHPLPADFGASRTKPAADAPAAKVSLTEPEQMTKRSQISWDLRNDIFRQIEANRRNARKSTGPKTEQGKQRSRRNAVRHGLTAETVIGALEDAEDYRAFEATIVADYHAQSAVERELVLRLANLLWRLRRATTMETGLFDIQADHLNRLESHNTILPTSRQFVYALLEPAALEVPTSMAPFTKSSVDFARCYLRLSNLPSYALDRLSRYEAILWRQVAQTLIALGDLDRRKPQERRRPVRFGDLQELPNRAHDDS